MLIFCQMIDIYYNQNIKISRKNKKIKLNLIKDIIKNYFRQSLLSLILEVKMVLVDFKNYQQ